MASYTLQIPRMFAALFLTTGLGIIIFLALTALSDALLNHWHESAVNRKLELVTLYPTKAGFGIGSEFWLIVIGLTLGFTFIPTLNFGIVASLATK